MMSIIRGGRGRLLLLAATLFIAEAQGFEPSFWVWNREAAIPAPQLEQLRAAGVRTLYWQAGSLRAEGGRWVSETPLRLPTEAMSGIALVPVFRLRPGKEDPLTTDAGKDLAVTVRKLAGARFDTVQIDFDCPDRLLAQYAGFLRACRVALAPTHLTATALAGWSRTPVFAALQESVEALFPMFYDLTPDAPADVREGHVLPLLDPAVVAGQIASWRKCRIPWHAGLPGFARVTVFNRQGGSRGHLRDWSWDRVCFNPTLHTLGEPAPGVTLLRAEADTTIGETAVAAEETVACRELRIEDLHQAITQARAAGASGVTIFRFPDRGASGGWSLAQWSALLDGESSSASACRLVRAGPAFELINDSSYDLPPRLAGPGGPRDRGWQLEVEAGGEALFREAGAGDFAAVFGHTQADASPPQPVPIALAERLTFWLADLPAGSRRRSGLLQLAPGADPARLRWRIPGSPHNAVWQPLE